MRIAILGTGAIGSLICSRLSTVPGIELLGHGRGESAAIHIVDGMRLESESETISTTPEQVTFTMDEVGIPKEFNNTFDLIILCSKSSSTEHLAKIAQYLLKDSGVAFSLQNGLGNEEILCEFLGVDRVLAATTTHGALVRSPGVVYWAGKGVIEIGSFERGCAPSSDLIEILQIAELNPVVSEDMKMSLWRKLLLNVAINPLAAITGVENGGLLESHLFDESSAVMLEASKVANASGIMLPEQLELIDSLREVLVNTSNNRCSMLQDVMAGRKTERSAITGELLRRAERLGISCPRIELLDATLRTIDDKSL